MKQEISALKKRGYALIDAERLWSRHTEMARFGATDRGGVNRLALTKIDIDAHVLLAD